jgi:hypothetical protein
MVALEVFGVERSTSLHVQGEVEREFVERCTHLRTEMGALFNYDLRRDKMLVLLLAKLRCTFPAGVSSRKHVPRALGP